MTQTSDQQGRTLQETRTTLGTPEVLEAARRFFQRRNNVYAVFLEREGPGHLVFRGQGGEELVIAAQGADGATRVTGSTYMFDQQLARFLSTLPPAPAPAKAPAATGATA